MIFNIRHPVEIANAMADSARMMELLLASIASIALFVGGHRNHEHHARVRDRAHAGKSACAWLSRL